MCELCLDPMNLQTNNLPVAGITRKCPVAALSYTANPAAYKGNGVGGFGSPFPSALFNIRGEEKNKMKNRKSKLALLAAIGFAGMTTASQAALTVTPASVYSTVESNFDAAALIGVAIAAVIWGIRFIKKGLRAA